MYNDLNNTGMLKASAAAPRESMLENLNSGVQESLKGLHTASNRLHSLADRVIGSRPEADGAAGQSNSPSGSSMQSLERSVSDLSNLTRMILDAVERLERL